MKRRLVGVLAVALAIVAAILLYWKLRGGDAKSPDVKTPVARGSGSAMIPSTPKAQPEAPPPQRPAQKWTLDTDPEGPLVLEGQVLGPDGKGVAKARVAITSVPARSVVTDDDGTFTIDKLVARTYQLTASATELVGGPVFYKLRDGSDPVVIHMSAGAGVDVSVVDEQQKPLKGATVKLGDQSERTAETNAEGKATLGPVQPGWIAVSASAPGYANGGALTTIGSAGATATITIAMKKGVAVSGKVVDEAGKPVAKARVFAQGAPGWGGGGREPDAETTNDKGEFSFAALAAGTTRLVAMDGEHAPSASEPVKIGTAPVTGVTITMTPGGVIAGNVVDAEGKPVPYATVRIAGAGRAQGVTPARQTTSDKSGAFELRGLSRLTLQARAESEIAASKLVPIDLTQKPRLDNVTLTLDVTGTIAGIVVDEKGKPVPEVSVNAYPDMLGGAKAENAALAGFSSATTDGEGKFVIRGLPDDQYRLWATRAFGADGGAWSRNSTPARVGDQNARLELPSPGGLKGKITLDGEPPKFATVQVGFGAPTPTAKGEFLIQDLAPGKYDLTLHSLEFSERMLRDVEVKPGGMTDIGTITVEKGRILTGRVVDGTGRPVANAKVRVGERLFSANNDDGQLDQHDALSNVRSAYSAADGSFTIIGVPDKVTSAAAETANGRSLPATIPGGAGNPPSVDLVIKGFGTIAGKVTRAGQPVAGVAVDEVVKGAPSQNSFAATREDGTYIIERVVEGTHVVTANERRQMTGRGGAITVQVTAGKTTTANIEIPSGDLSLEVTIKPAAGAKVDSAQMFLFGGSVSVDNGQALVDKTLDGGSVFMRFWFSGKPPTVFDEMAAGTYSLCSIPITGDMNNATFVQRIQENIPALKVVCTPVTLKPAPKQQAIVQELPSMSPLPPPS